MSVDYGLEGKEKKAFIAKVAETVGEKIEYQGAPTFAYKIGHFTIDRECKLSWDDGVTDSQAELIVELLMDAGYEPTTTEEGLCVFMPLEGFTDEALSNLRRLIEAKKELIKRAFLVAEPELLIEEDKIGFPWFPQPKDGDETNAYILFVKALCDMAMNQKRVSAKPKEIINEKYEFRCFLLRLGFIGDESKKERKILLQNLDGSAAFKTGGAN